MSDRILPLPSLSAETMGAIVRVGPWLTATQRFRLVEIAHETKDAAVRSEALGMLRGHRLSMVSQTTSPHYAPIGADDA